MALLAKKDLLQLLYSAATAWQLGMAVLQRPLWTMIYEFHILYMSQNKYSFDFFSNQLKMTENIKTMEAAFIQKMERHWYMF